MTVPHEMTVDQFSIRVDTAPGSGKSITYTVTKNGTDTDLTCTIADDNLTASDTTHSVTFAQGDLMSIKVVPSGTPALSSYNYSCLRQTAEHLFGTSVAVSGPSNSATTYVPYLGITTNGGAEAGVSGIVPTSGVISNLHVNTSAAPGANPKARVITLVKNGTPTTLTATVIGVTTTTASDPTHTVSVSAGDLLSFEIEPVDSPNSASVAISTSFAPAIDGEFFSMLANDTNSPSTSNTQHAGICSGPGSAFWTNSATSNRRTDMGETTTKAIYAATNTSPGASSSYTFALLDDGAATDASVTIADAATSASLTGLSDSIDAGSLVQLRSVPAGSPSSVTVKVSVLFYTAPAAEQSPPSTILTTADGTTFSSSTPELAFVGVDVNGDDVSYEVEIAPRRRIGLWVWTFSDVVGDTDEENILLNECVASGITDLYCYTFASEVTAAAAAIRTFIARCSQLGIRVWGLDGARDYFSDVDGPAQLFTDIDAIATYNAGSSADERFHGFQINMEPADLGDGQSFHNGLPSSALNTTPASGVWQDTQADDREYLMRDWVQIHADVQGYCHARDLAFGSALPTFLDDYFGEPISCLYDSETQNVYLHLATYCENIQLMSYNTNPHTVINRVVYELTREPVRTAGFSLETVVGVGSGISYGDTSGKQTKAALWQDMEITDAHFGDNLTYRWFNIHDWSGYKALSPVSNDTTNPL